MTDLERAALQDLRHSRLEHAEPEELVHIWHKLAQWHKTADDRGAVELAAGHLLQEMVVKGIDVEGSLVQMARSRSTLADRIAELPESIVLSSPAVALSHDDLDLYVAASEGWHGEAVIDQLADVGVPAQMDMMLPGERSADAADLYDLALVRSDVVRKSINASMDPPEWVVKQEHRGAMLALMAPPSARSSLEQAGLLRPEAPDELHITLLYLGEAATLSQAMLAAIQANVAAVCAEHRALRLKMSGVGRFEQVMWGAVSAVGLSQLQADLERAVRQVIRLPSEHGWIPHMTLGSFEGDLPDFDVDELPAWPAESVILQVADTTLETFPLLGRRPSESASWMLGPRRQLPGAEVKTSARVLCSSEPEKQIIYYMVSEPDAVDAHGHRISKADVEQALWSYMAGERHMHIEHGPSIDGRAVVVEGYIAPCELKSFHGAPLFDEPVPEGASIVGVHYPDRQLWKRLSAEPHGISWGGFAQKEDLP